MQVIANDNLVRTRVRLASTAHLAALAVFGIGLFVSWNNPEPTVEQMMASYAAIVVGLVLYNVGQVLLRRYGPRFRQATGAGVMRGLKGLDRRYTLLTFADSKLPDYLLVGPGGVQVIVPRTQKGEITFRANRWSTGSSGGWKRLFGLFGGQPLGDPSRDVATGIQRVRDRLRKRDVDGDVPVDGVVVFTDPAVKLRVESGGVPVTTAKGLRNVVRPPKSGRDKGIDETHVASVVQALLA